MREALSCFEVGAALGYLPELDAAIRDRFDKVLGTLTSRHASTSRSDPTAVQYRDTRMRPWLYDPSARLSGALLSARRHWSPRFASRAAIVSSSGLTSRTSTSSTS
jgi:hypothetical protein